MSTSEQSKLISIVTPCYNEVENVEELVTRVKAVMQTLPYRYEHIIIDNASTDGTIDKLRHLANKDSNLKLIINSRNFGHIRSPHHAILQSRGDACIWIASDLQDPPELIADFVRKWEEGYKIVMAVKPASDESRFMFSFRKTYYRFLAKISEVPLVQNATGVGLYDKQIVDILREIDDPYPYFRGLIREVGFPVATVEFIQPRRRRGITKNNFYTLYDIAFLGIVKHSKVPLRLMAMLGFIMSALSLLMALVFFIAKLLFWNFFTVGVAPILIGMFFFAAVQMFFMGILGEYIGMIYTQVRGMPLVIEKERVNF